MVDNCFPPRSEIKRQCPLSPHLLSTEVGHSETMASVLRQEKERKSIQIGKEGVKMSLSADYEKIYEIYEKNLVESTKKLQFSKIAR